MDFNGFSQGRKPTGRKAEMKALTKIFWHFEQCECQRSLALTEHFHGVEH